MWQVLIIISSPETLNLIYPASESDVLVPPLVTDEYVVSYGFTWSPFVVITVAAITEAAVAALADFKNPYNTKQTAIVNYTVGTGADENAGLIGIVGDGPKSNGFPTTVYVNSCVKIPCNPGENRIHSTLTF